MPLWNREKKKFTLGVLKSVMREEIQSIQENKERVSLICGEKIINVPSLWDEGQLNIQISPDFVQKECGNNKPWVMHTHILHPSKPSRFDFIGHNAFRFFTKGLCTVGADGMECYTSDGKRTFDRRWSPAEFAPNFKQIGGQTWSGTEVFCDYKDHKYHCEMQHDNASEPMGVFDQIATIGGSQLVGNTPESDFSLYSHTPNEQIQCYTHANESKLMCQIMEKVIPKK